MKPLIKLENVSVIYGSGETESTAISDINLEIYPGEYIVFFGPSGCGKSTLLYTIAGLEVASKGTVYVDGINPKEVSAEQLIDFYRLTIGMIFQAFYLVPHLSIKDNLVLSKIFSGEPKESREVKAVELMGRFGLAQYANKKPAQMSGGQQQRTAIARALMNDPKIILADEPVGNLDSKNSEIVLKLLADIHANEKRTIIQVTHNPKDIHYADRVFYMKDGKIERIVVNKDNGIAPSVSQGSSELDKLAAAFPDLSASRLKSRMITRHLISSYDITTEQKIESQIEKYVNHEISAEELYHFMDSSKDGIGLDTRTAQHFTKQISELVSEFKRIDEASLGVDASGRSKGMADVIMEHLSRQYRVHLDHLQVERLRSFVEKRVDGSMSEADFLKYIDLSFAKGGVGFDRRTAQKIAQEVDFMLAKK